MAAPFDDGAAEASRCADEQERFAEEQRGGVGRFGRPWMSPRGGLWCTFAAPVPEDARLFMEGLGLRIGVTCAEFVESLLPEGFGDPQNLPPPETKQTPQASNGQRPAAAAPATRADEMVNQLTSEAEEEAD